NQPAGGFGQTLYVRVETIATGCYDIVELKLVVDPLPNITQPNYPQYSLCDYDQSSIGHETFDLGSRVSAILLNQTGMTVTFYPSLTEAQNNQNAINNLMYINVPMYVQTLGIRITNNQTGCYSISTMDIRVEPLPTPTPPTQPFTICDGDQNGIACNIDLTTLSTGIVGGAAYNISFHETLTDAQLGGTTIPNPTSYCNIHPFTQTLYVRLTDQLTGCWSVMPIVLIINPSPIAPVNVPNIEVCDYDNNTQDGYTMVNLTQNTAMILAQQPLGASNYTIEYYTTKALAEAGLLPIIQTTNYYGHNGDIIWVRVEDNTTGCYNLGSFQLIINKPLLLTTPTPLSLCDDDNQPNNQFTTFDLTVRNTMINQGLGSGYTVTYYTDAPVTPTSV
ncbi:adhesin, partial [Flavobacterium sp. XGLA_31]